MPTPLREQVIAAVAARLALLTGVRVERNRDREIEPSKMPMLVLVDGGHSVDEGNSGFRRYVLRLSIEGYVAAATPAGLGPDLSDLYARSSNCSPITRLAASPSICAKATWPTR